MHLMKTILWALLGQVVSHGLVITAALICPGKWAVLPFAVCAVGIAAMLIGALVGLKRATDEGRLNVTEEYRRAQLLRDELEKDLALGRKTVLELEKRAWCAWACMLVLGMAVCFFAGAAFGYDGAGIGIATAFGIFYLPSFEAFLLIRPEMFSCFPGAEVQRKNFPKLFGVIDNAAQRMGYRRRIRVFIGDDNSIGVFCERRFDGLMIPTLMLELLTKDELGQILLHEFSHLTSKESKREFRWCRLLAKRDRAADQTELSMPAFTPVYAALAEFEAEMKRYRMMSERVLEKEADRQILTGGNTAAAVSAIVKAGLYQRFMELDRESSFRIYAPEKPERNLTEIRRSKMQQMLKKYGERWIQDMENELPSLFDTHPTLRQRREALGVEKYDPFSRESDPEWLAEVEKLFAQEDNCHVSNPVYDQTRNMVYIHRKEYMEDFERAKKPFETLGAEELCDAARAYYGLNDEKAFSILREVVNRNPRESLAKLMLGAWLLENCDEEGLELLYEVAQNGNVTSSALQSIGEYVYLSGNRALVDEFEARMQQLLQKSYDFHSALDRVHLKNLGPRSMPDALLAELVDEMVRLADGGIAEIGCAARMMEGEADAHVFVLKYIDPDDEDRTEEIYGRIFRLLDQREENYALIEDRDIPVEKLEKRIPGSRVYVQK